MRRLVSVPHSRGIPQHCGILPFHTPVGWALVAYHSMAWNCAAGLGIVRRDACRLGIPPRCHDRPLFAGRDACPFLSRRYPAPQNPKPHDGKFYASNDSMRSAVCCNRSGFVAIPRRWHSRRSSVRRFRASPPVIAVLAADVLVAVLLVLLVWHWS